jgi:hypothetical protein
MPEAPRLNVRRMNRFSPEGAPSVVHALPSLAERFLAESASTERSLAEAFPSERFSLTLRALWLAREVICA